MNSAEDQLEAAIWAAMTAHKVTSMHPVEFIDTIMAAAFDYAAGDSDALTARRRELLMEATEPRPRQTRRSAAGGGGEAARRRELSPEGLADSPPEGATLSTGSVIPFPGQGCSNCVHSLWITSGGLAGSDLTRRADDVNEHQFTEVVEQLAADRGLLTHFCSDARRCRGPRGFPDLVIVGRFGIVFAELKVDENQPTPLQNLWLWTLDEATCRSAIVYTAVWRPSDLGSEGVVEKTMDLLVQPMSNRHHGSRPTNATLRRPRANIPHGRNEARPRPA